MEKDCNKFCFASSSHHLNIVKALLLPIIFENEISLKLNLYAFNEILNRFFYY